MSVSQRQALFEHCPRLLGSETLTGEDVSVHMTIADDEGIATQIHKERIYSFDIQHQRDRLHLKGYHFSANIWLEPRMRVDVTTDASAGDLVCSVLENLLRFLVAYRLLSLGGVLLHSACAVRDEQAYLFFGVSGAGKSTLSRRAVEAGWQLLSDDLNAVTLEGDRIFVQQVPFTGIFDSPAQVTGQFPLAQIFLLEQHPTNSIGCMMAGRAMASLIVCSPFVNVDPFRRDMLQDVLLSLGRHMPVKRLRFRQDIDAELIPKLLESQHG